MKIKVGSHEKLYLIVIFKVFISFYSKRVPHVMVSVPRVGVGQSLVSPLCLSYCIESVWATANFWLRLRIGSIGWSERNDIQRVEALCSNV